MYVKAFWSNFGWRALLAIPCALVSQIVVDLSITIVAIAVGLHNVALEAENTPAVVLVISPWVYVAEFLVFWLIWFWILGALRRRFSKKP